MVLLQIDPERVAFLEFKCNAPWPVNMGGIPLGLALQAVEVPAGNIHSLNLGAGKRRQGQPTWLLQRSCVHFF